jgi:hypothetical protein
LIRLVENKQMAEKASTRLFSVSLRSSDRDETIYPTASHYALEFPAIDNVVGVQVASIELPEYDTHYTIQTNLNDKFTFSEGLRIDFNSLVSDVDQVTDLDLYPNQVCIREGTNNFVVSIPAYLTEITSFSSNNLVTPDLACDAGWRKCWLDWQASNPTAPALSVVCSTAGYVGQLVANSLGTKLSITADEAKFRYGYVHLPPVSTAEICSFLSFAFQNYSTYSNTPSSRPSTYTFAYKHGRVCVESTNTTSSLHFVTTANAAQTAWYGSQNNGFATRMMLNNATPGITSMMYMLGFSSSNRQTSQLKVLRRQAELTVSGFIADQPPRFLFEARLPQGVYTPADLVTQLPIAMNPLNFVQPSSTTTTTTTAMGAGYFGFRDSAGRESLIVVNSGRYTPETFCQAIEYALNRQDTNGPYFSSNRFSYGPVPLSFTLAQAWPSVTKPAVVYSVVYSYSTNKFTIMSAVATSTKPFDPSTATVLSSKAGQTFGLLFDPTSIAKIAAQIPDLSSMCGNANLDRMARTFGMAMRDYTSGNSYTSENQVFIPRIAFPLSVMVDIFRYDDPSEMGIGNASTAVGAGTPTYLFPTGTYAVTGATPPVRSINLSSQCQPSMVSTSTNYSTFDITAAAIAIANEGYLASDYTISGAGGNIATNTYLAMDIGMTSDVSASASIIRATSVSYDKDATLATISVIDTGVGSISASKPFDGIYSDDMMRMLTISNVASNEPHMLISQHANQVSSTNKAYMTTKPFGFQVSDIVSTRCISNALVLSTQVNRILTAPTWLSPNRGLLVGQTYTLTSTGALVAGSFYLVVGGDRNAVVQATTANVVVVVEPGSGFFPTVGATASTYRVRGPIMYHAWQGIVVQQANSGAHFTDSTNAQRDQYMACLPYLSQSLSCTAAKTVDGACMRLRVPSGFVQQTSSVYLSGNLNFVNEFYQARLDVHIEDLAGLKANHAGTILGVGKANLAMSSTLSMPNAINLDAVSYVMLKFIGLNNQRSNQIHWTDSKMLGDLVTKVVLGAPTSIVRGLLSSVEFAKQRIGRLELAFYMPDGQTLYDFHGLEHSLTLNFMIRDPVAKRKFDQV